MTLREKCSGCGKKLGGFGWSKIECSICGRLFCPICIKIWDKDTPEIGECKDCTKIIYQAEEKELDEKMRREFKMAENYEIALNYDEAAKIYEKYSLWEEAGRCRKLNTKLQAHLTKIEIGQIHKSISISDSVIYKANIGNNEEIVNKVEALRERDEILQKYRKILVQVLADGVIDDNEAKILAIIRESDYITLDEHNQILTDILQAREPAL